MLMLLMQTMWLSDHGCMPLSDYYKSNTEYLETKVDFKSINQTSNFRTLFNIPSPLTCRNHSTRPPPVTHLSTDTEELLPVMTDGQMNCNVADRLWWQNRHYSYLAILPVSPHFSRTHSIK